jgi:chaperonin GroEL
MKEFAKAKTASKIITYDNKDLKKIVLTTLRKISDLVGSTLGPNGKIVLIERQENLGPYTTKDGITVFNSIAFSDSTAQAVLEAARDSSSKTNVEAGDGTTTATILAEALIRLGFEYLQKNPHMSVQKVMRELETSLDKVIIPFIAENSIKVSNDNADDLLRKVAMISTNSDTEMASAVLDCFNLVGYNGNITIAETAGASGFDIEKVEGFPIARGFEDTCGRFIEEFINDKGNYRTILERPRFILYNGKINSMSSILPAIEHIGQSYDLAIQNNQKFSPNIVIVAHHFSEDVLAQLAYNFKQPGSLNILPLKTVMTQQANSPYHMRVDLAAFTSATVFDPLSKPIESLDLADLGVETMESFEYYRYKSVVLGRPDEFLVISRSEELEKQAQQAESSLDAEILRERLAILTGGIARLKVKGSSEAELKEKRHRVEDAVAAIKGALKYGILPGCAKTLLVLANEIQKSPEMSDAVKQIMPAAFTAPFERIMTNGGHNKAEINEVCMNMMYSVQTFTEVNIWKRLSNWITKKPNTVRVAFPKPFWNTYDAMNFKYGNGVDIGVVDSASAVMMAIKNSLGVAKMLMGLSGIVVFQRDHELDSSSSKNAIAEEAVIQEAIKNSEKEKWDPPF